MTISSDFLSLIKERRSVDSVDSSLQNVIRLLGLEQAKEFVMGSDGVLRFRGMVCVPDDVEVKRLILEKGHKSRFTLHLGMTKMYQDLKETFWWQGMKKDMA